jgi:hypothetical protein
MQWYHWLAISLVAWLVLSGAVAWLIAPVLARRSSELARPCAGPCEICERAWEETP